MNVLGVFCRTVLLVIPLMGCNSPKPQDIVGKWLPDEHSPRIIKNVFLPKPILLAEQPSFVFGPDANFVMQNMPGTLVFGPGRERNRIISGNGKWSVGKYAGSEVVFLEFAKIDGKEITSATQIQISKGPQGVVLYFWIEEEGGERFEFVKQA